MPPMLAQLVQVRSQTVEGLLHYLELVMRAPDRTELLPAYMSTRSLTALYVEPDVLKRERQVDQPSPPLDRGDRGARQPSDRAAHEGTRLPPEALDIGEIGLYGEREDETERRVAWTTERDQMRLTPESRAVLIGPPGQGKSLLVQMTARFLATAAHNDLDSQRVGLDALTLPIILPLDALARSGIREGESPDQALRRALYTILRAQFDSAQVPDHILRYLAAHAHENRTWLLLDALDEVTDRDALTTFWAVLQQWQCRVLITSRPYGYEAQRLPFNVNEYRLAPLSTQQAQEFVGKWFPEGEGRERMKGLILRSPSIQQVSQNPFLLTLMCWVAERHPLAEGITRTEIYERALHDLLGLHAKGKGEVDDERARDLLPLLSEVALPFFQENPRQTILPSDRLKQLIAANKNLPVPLDKRGVKLELDDLVKLTEGQRANYILADYLVQELVQKRLLVPLSHDHAAYVFPHRSILEFLTACALAALVDKPNGKGWQEEILVRGRKWTAYKFLDKQAWLPEWQEVIVFMAGRLSNSAPLLKMLSYPKPTPTNPCGDDMFGHRLALAAMCLPELLPGIHQARTNLIDRNTDETRGELIDLVNSLTDAVFHVWWKHKTQNTEGAIKPLTDALPALAAANGRIKRSTGQRVLLLLTRRETRENLLPLLDRLVRSLADGDWGVRRHAAEALGQMGAAAVRPEILDRLVRLLADGDGDVRRRAAAALGQMGAAAVRPDVVDALVRSLADGDRDVRGNAARALGQMGAGAVRPDAVDALVRSLTDGHGRVRMNAAEALGQLGAAAVRPDVVDALVRSLADGDRDVRGNAARALGQLGAAAVRPDVVDALVRSLADGDRDVRGNAARALGQLGAAAVRPDAVDALVHMLADGDEYVRGNAARALGQMGAAAVRPDVVDALVHMLADGDVRGRAAAALGQMMQSDVRLFKAWRGLSFRWVTELAEDL